MAWMRATCRLPYSSLACAAGLDGRRIVVHRLRFVLAMGFWFIGCDIALDIAIN
jgi:hypothetical protein